LLLIDLNMFLSKEKDFSENEFEDAMLPFPTIWCRH
jgi:hypothetical protein